MDVRFLTDKMILEKINNILSDSIKNVNKNSTNLKIKGFVILIGANELQQLKECETFNSISSRTIIEELKERFNIEFFCKGYSGLEIAIKF